MMEDDLSQVLARQRAAFDAAMPEPLALRDDRLARAAALIADHAERFCAAVSDDFGHRSREQTMLADIAASVASLRHARRHLRRWARRERRPVQFPLGLFGARAWVEWQPKGVVGIIAPWNFPINLVMSPLAGAFAAGNRAMVKLSEYTPATAALFVALAPDYFAAEELAFVTGDAAVGQAFAGLPFDHLLFTGATGIARHILHAAAENLVPVTLELGGKSPAVIGRGADLARAGERIVSGKLLNAGQVCLAPDYLLVPEAEEPAMVAALQRAAARQYPTLLANPDATAIASDAHHARLTAWIEEARAKGAEVIALEPAGEAPEQGNGRKLPLTLIRGATDDMRVMQEEIFGPVLPIRTYRAIDDAVAEIARRPRPLALYYFGGDAAERRRVLDRTISGGVTLDDVVYHVAQESLPFGGIGASGTGAYHGEDGCRTFSHARSVFRQSRWDVSRLAGLTPPYGHATWATIRRQMGTKKRAARGRPVEVLGEDA
jgi:coniferyl-aldehyde dehydrogenase